ncbi:DUF1593 domain-containing protein [candidate division KSB1 bacterium]|nr:DUF1593 domain-containing protein [candidate division KSB1 bacterium]RQW00827.1 MAG: DUF1593 domain-containing protein [candidate division KSB1 bacterium]
MKHLFYFVTSLVLCAVVTLGASEKQRVIVLTDISNEPDDEESMVRFLVYSNEYDVEGLIATTSVWLQDTTRLDLIQRQIKAYGLVRNNLLKHAHGYPTADELLSVSAAGQPEFGMAGVGFGKTSPGSQHIMEVIDRPDDRPVWVAVWGGANTLAQALWDVKYSRTPEELAKFVAKIRVYTISDQDDAGRWLRITFPDLFYIVSPSSVWWTEYYKATWTGISGDRHYQNGPGHFFDLVDNPWLTKNIAQNHGPLGELYPRVEYIMEGDTPSFLNLINNGLGSHLSPACGGWGGRYQLEQTYAETRPIWTNSRDRVQTQDGSWYTTAQATIWRWREAYQHDFAARMDWCVAENYADANHNPVAVLNGEKSKDIMFISATPGERIELSASGSYDPDGDLYGITWFHYSEAGTLNGEIKLSSLNGETTSFTVPEVAHESTLHIILQLKDHGTPNLFSYQRAIITVPRPEKP